MHGENGVEDLTAGVKGLQLGSLDLPSLLRSRAAYAGNVTKCINKLREDLDATKEVVTIEEDIERLQEAAKKLTDCNEEIVHLAKEQNDLNEIVAAEKYLNDVLGNVAKATELAGIYIIKSKTVIAEDDQLSRVS